MLLNPYRFVASLPPPMVGPTPALIGTVVGVASGYAPVALPAGWAVGDLLLIVANSGPDVYVKTPGWNQQPMTTGGEYSAIRVFWKIAQAGEPSVTMATGISRHIPVLMCIRNAAPWPISVLVEGTHSSASRLMPDITTLTDNCRIFQAASDQTGSYEARASAWANGSIALTEIADTGTDWNTGGGLAVVHGEMASTGAIGSTSFSWGNADSGSTVSLAVNPTQDAIPTPAAGSKAVVMATAGSSTAVLPWSINIPAGTESGDMAILSVCTNEANAGVPSTPAGWTLLGTQANASATRGHFYYRQIDGTEGTSVGGNLSGTNTWSASISILPVGSFVAGSTPEIVAVSTSETRSLPCPTISPSWGNKWTWAVSVATWRQNVFAPQLSPNSTFTFADFTNAMSVTTVSEKFGGTVAPGRWNLVANVTGGAVVATIVVRRT